MLKTLAAASALALSVLAPSSAAAAETLKLNLADPANAVLGSAAVTSTPLVPGAKYVVTISGTGSLWSPVDTPAPVTCGAPEAAPIVEPTPGAVDAVATVDAALIFAAPIGVSLWDTLACDGPNPAVPPAPSGLRMGTGGVLEPAVPLGGVPAAASPSHTYAYAVTGTGAPLELQLFDVHPDDNSGILTITIRAEDECAVTSCLDGLVPPPAPQVMLPDRTGGTPAPSPAGGAPVAPGAATPVLPQAASLSDLPADLNDCLSSTVLSVRLKAKKGQLYSKAVYWLNGKRVAKVAGKKLYISKRATKTRRSRRVLRVQKFRKLPKGKVVLKVMVKTKGGKVMRSKKTFYRCTAPNKKAKSISFATTKKTTKKTAPAAKS